MSYTKEQRIEQIRAIALDIAENAEKIIGDFDADVNWKVIIDIECNSVPTVKIHHEIVPKKLIELYKVNI